MRRYAPALLALALACNGGSPEPEPTPDPPAPVTLRVATYNTSLYRDAEGDLLTDLADPNQPQLTALAAILQEVQPDLILLNEVDYDAAGDAARLLRDNFLNVSQGGRTPLDLPYAYIPEVNTGVPSGVDLNGDNKQSGPIGTDAYGNDCLGFGSYPGQYGLVVLSRYPIGDARTFRKLLWKNVPNADLPPDFYSAEALAVLPLSSKTHADVPIDVGGHTLHFLVSHPTPPSFDGSEDRNGRRNHDEVTFWRDYIAASEDGWQVDDLGGQGGLGGGSFVIAGDMNADPFDGDSRNNPLGALLASPLLQDPLPTSLGASEQSGLQGGANTSHLGDPGLDTTDFNDSTVGNLRIDFVLPSTDLVVHGAGVFWPEASDPNFSLVGTFPFPVSDHRLVWVDLEIGANN